METVCQECGSKVVSYFQDVRPDLRLHVCVCNVCGHSITTSSDPITLPASPEPPEEEPE